MQAGENGDRRSRARWNLDDVIGSDPDLTAIQLDLDRLSNLHRARCGHMRCFTELLPLVAQDGPGMFPVEIVVSVTNWPFCLPVYPQLLLNGCPGWKGPNGSHLAQRAKPRRTARWKR